MACVQKYERTVIFVVDVSGVPNVTTVGVRGEGAPLSWQRDTPITPVKDSAGLYTATVTARTGFLAREVKFVVNGVFEFSGTADEASRVVRFPRTTTGGDTVRFRAVFNSRR
jgi:putative oxidoreductase